MPRRFWNVLIKGIVIAGFLWFVSRRFSGGEDLHAVWQAFLANLQRQPLWMPVLVILLMPCNWLTEVIKWRTLMAPEINLSWRRAIAGVLSGITFSLFMPNRTGEFCGRVLYVRAPNRWQAVVASVTGSFAQNLVYVVFGITGALVFFDMATAIPLTIERGVWMLALCMVAAFLVLYYHLPEVARIAGRWSPPRWMQRAWNAWAHLEHTKKHRLSVALGLSVVRYGIFLVQYVLLLRYFGAEVSWLWLFTGVGVIFLVQTSLPLPPLMDILTRNEVGIILWTGLGVGEPSIVSAGLTIWILNLAFPAFFGLIAISAVNVLRTFGYESRPAASLTVRSGPVDLD